MPKPNLSTRVFWGCITVLSIAAVLFALLAVSSLVVELFQ